jgi:hypothetical protein
MSKQQKPSALKRKHPTLPKMKFINFFLCWWVIFAYLNPDTDPWTPLNPDPQHCSKGSKKLTANWIINNAASQKRSLVR